MVPGLAPLPPHSAGAAGAQFLPGRSWERGSSITPRVADWLVEFCSQLCLRTSLGPRLRRDGGHVASPPRARTALPRAAGAPARAGGERSPRHSFAGRPQQGSEPPGTSRPLRGSAELRWLGGRSPTRFPPGLQAPPAPRQAEREPGCSLPDAAPERGPTPSLPEPAGCATLLAARENPFLASASSSCILEHVSECITTRSLIEIQLGDLAPQPSALTWAIAPRPAVRARGHAGPEQGRGRSSTAQPRASTTPGAYTAGGCRLCPSPRHSKAFTIPGGRAARSVHNTVQRCRGSAGREGCSTEPLQFTPMPPGVNPALPIPVPSLGVQGAVWGEGEEDPPWWTASPLLFPGTHP